MKNENRSNRLVVVGNFDSVRQRRRVEVDPENIAKACNYFVGELRLASLYFQRIAISTQHFVDGALFIELGPQKLLNLVGRQTSSVTRELPIAVFSTANDYEDAIRQFVSRPNPTTPGNLYPMEFASIRRGVIDRRKFAEWLGSQPAVGHDWKDPIAKIHSLLVKFAKEIGQEQAGRLEADRLAGAWRSWASAQDLYSWNTIDSAPSLSDEFVDEIEFTRTLEVLTPLGRDCLKGLRSQLGSIGRSQQRSFVRGQLSGLGPKLEEDGDVINDWYDSLSHRVFAHYASTSYKEIVEKKFFSGDGADAADARLERAGWKAKLTDGFLPIKLQDGWLSVLAAMPASKFEEMQFILRDAQRDWWESDNELARQRINYILNQTVSLESFSKRRKSLVAKLSLSALGVALAVIADANSINLTLIATGVSILLLLPDVIVVFRILPWVVGSLVTTNDRFTQKRQF